MCHSLFRGASFQDHGAPALEADAGGMALGKPAVDVGERYVQQRRISLDLIGNEPKAIRRNFVAGAFG